MIRLIGLLERIVHQQTNDILGEGRAKTLTGIAKKQTAAEKRAEKKAAENKKGTRAVGSKKGVTWEPEDVVRSPGKRDPIKFTIGGKTGKDIARTSAAAKRKAAEEEAHKEKRIRDAQRKVIVSPPNEPTSPEAAAKKAGESDPNTQVSKVKLREPEGESRKRPSGRIRTVGVVTRVGKQGMDVATATSRNQSAEDKAKEERERKAKQREKVLSTLSPSVRADLEAAKKRRAAKEAEIVAQIAAEFQAEEEKAKKKKKPVPAQIQADIKAAKARRAKKGTTPAPTPEVPTKKKKKKKGTDTETAN